MKKNINILLVITVICLWGTACYRYVKNNFQGAPSWHTNINYTGRPFEHIVKRDTFELKLPSRDPFLGEPVTRNSALHRRPGSAIQPLRKHKSITKLAIPEIVWPEITYFGNISSGSSEMAVIKVGTKIYRLHCGEQASGITLKNITKDKVEVLYLKQSKEFRLTR